MEKITGAKSAKPACKYGANCYRKNPEQIVEYDHPKPQAKRQLEKATKMFLFQHTPPKNLCVNPAIPFIIGRGSECTLRLPFGDVSRKHAVIQYNEADSTWLVKDCSTNGISIDGEAVPSKTTTVIAQSNVLSMQVKYVNMDNRFCQKVHTHLIKKKSSTHTLLTIANVHTKSSLHHP